MNEIDPKNPAGSCCGRWTGACAWFQSFVLLLLRVGFGYQFMLTGWAKLNNIDKFAETFKRWGIPMPRVNVMMAGTTECVGGVLLLLGLASRIISVPLTIVMLVAYSTAKRAAIVGLFNPTPDPKSGQIDGLVERIRNAFDQDPFPFLCAALVILAFGPGRVSLDHLIMRMRRKPIAVDVNPVRS